MLKLDIDPSQETEEALIAQILADESLAALIDELYYEHHVHLSPMSIKAWANGLHGNKTQQTIETSYEIFTRLREMGIRAHSWI